jgi:FtsH-binding integral membrane protein
MTYTQEKMTYGVAALSASAASTIGAMMTEGESRWFFVTMTSSILTACFLALIFKRADEGIRLVIGRAGLSIMGGVLASRAIVHHWQVNYFNEDIVLMAGLAAGVTIGCFIVGYPLLQLINSKSGTLAERIFKKWMP